MTDFPDDDRDPLTDGWPDRDDIIRKYPPDDQNRPKDCSRATNSTPGHEPGMPLRRTKRGLGASNPPHHEKLVISWTTAQTGGKCDSRKDHAMHILTNESLRKAEQVEVQCALANLYNDLDEIARKNDPTNVAFASPYAYGFIKGIRRAQGEIRKIIIAHGDPDFIQDFLDGQDQK